MAAAEQYLVQNGEPVPQSTAPAGGAFLLSGHQPELFHPGVWLKNFAINGLARRLDAESINLVIDTDSAKPPSLRVPGWDAPEPPPACDPKDVRHLSFPFDLWTKDIPYEERPVIDEALFASLPDRVAPQVRGWTYAPLLEEFWGEVRKQSARTHLLGERVAGARRAFERRWGCHNWEVPMSRLCDSEPFAWFACHLLAHLPRFHDAYNGCLSDYRRANGVRSRTRPMPDLASEGDWLEAPFWAWHGERSRRSRLFARLGGGAVTLRVDGNAGPTLPLSPAGGAGAVAAWRAADAAGFRIRSRALTTTLFARLLVADVFTHGIGGGKYDEITDEIIRRFFGLEPPRFQVLSATLLLPLPHYPAEPDDCRRLAAELRDLYWNPQRHVNGRVGADLELSRLLAEKSEWVTREPNDPDGRLRRFQRLRQLTDGLRESVNDRRSRAEVRDRRCRQEVEANAVLARRDYAFCLYPEHQLREFMTSFL